MKPPNCGVTFVPLHAGHLGFAFSCSEIVMVSSKGFLHFSQRYTAFAHHTPCLAR